MATQIVIASGTCGAQGDNLTWVLTSDSVLTISGSGDMRHFDLGIFAPWFPHRQTIKTAVIEDGVTNIGARAFFAMGNITTVTIGNSVTSIGEGAFFGCRGLTSAVIPYGVTSIGENAFFSANLTSIDIPNSVTTIGESAFAWNRHSTSINIPSSVTFIGQEAFGMCDSLTAINVDADNLYYSSVNGVLFNKTKTRLIRYPSAKPEATFIVPESVEIIEFRAFGNSRYLTSIYVDSNNQHYTSENGVLFDKLKTTLIQYPTGKPDAIYIIPNGVTTIADDAFARNKHLTFLTIPSSVTSIGIRAFWHCDNLASVISYALEPPALMSSMFFRGIALYVPAEAIELYREADGWHAFGTISAIETR